MKWSVSLIGCFFCLFMSSRSYTQDSLATSVTFKEVFRSPVNYKIRLSGSFGELRSNHFHTGIDIKGKNSTAGDSIVSVMSGHVSRIRIQSGSYGKCLYIDHPNGMTSVYAHLDKFSPEIERMVKEKQTATESFEIDLYLPGDRITLKQGDYIGILGNTGRSYGPHLHFELRDTKTELALNPLYFDFGITDRKAPFISQVIIHELDTNFQILNKQKLSSSQSVAYCSESLVGVGFKGFDTMDGSSNYNGIADIKMYADNKLVYSSVFDTLSFDQFRYINACIDYEEKLKNNSTYYLCYRQPNNQLTNLKKLRNDGIIPLKDTVNIKIVVKDLSNNRAVKELILINKSPQKPILRQHTKAPSRLRKRSNNAVVDIPSKCFYKKEKIQFGYDTLSQKIQIGNKMIPCHDYYELTVTGIDYNPKLQLFYEQGTDQWIKVGGHMVQDTFGCKVNRFGLFKLMEDTTAPTIGFLSDSFGSLKFKVEDNFPVSGSAEDLYIQVHVDGRWIPFYYKELVKQLIIRHSDVSGEILKIRVFDSSGNMGALSYKLK